MKSVDCNVIRDLLPSYGAELLSKESNNLIEEHMKICSECREVMRNMGIETNKVYNQDESIDYLKGYRKKKIFSIIIAVIITILVIFDTFCIGSKFLLNHKFYMNIEDVKLCYRGEGEFRGNKILDYIMNSNSKFLVPFCYPEDVVKDTENGIVYMKLVGSFNSDWYKGNSTTCFCWPEIDDDTKSVYLIDGKDNKIKIWDKEQGALTDILPTIK